MSQQDLFKDTITCPTCDGTGDLYNHERETNLCYTCEGKCELTKDEYDRFLSEMAVLLS